MMLRFVINNLRQKWISARPALQCRYMSYKTEIVIGGGLEKPQGGLKEEKYFYKQNCDLIDKICKQDTKLKCENNVNNWKNQIEKALSSNDSRTALRETCSLNKHKNCLEEAYFLNEQNACFLILNKNDDFMNEKRKFETSVKNKKETA